MDILKRQFPIKSLIFLKSNCHAKMAPDTLFNCEREIGHCHINRFYCSLLASPLDSDFNKFNDLASRQGAARERLLARCDNAGRA
jgi:hypothetical protein